MAAYRRVMTYGHLRADCLYTGISSGPNARCKVWESLYLFLYLYILTTRILYLFGRHWHQTSRHKDCGIPSLSSQLMHQERMRISA